MLKYELALIINPTLEEDALNKEVEAVKELIAKFGGNIENIDNWSKRKLAYEIKKFNEGFYYFIKFTAEPTLPQELEQRLRIKENIIRYLVVKEDV